MTKTKESESQNSLDADKVADNYIECASTALDKIRNFTQEQVDIIAHEFAMVIYDQAEKRAKEAVKEGGLGNVPDKILKQQNKAEGIWNEIRNLKTVGVIERNDEKRLIKIAEPVGIVAGVCPCTNPVVTAMSYAILAIKTRNALIISAHPRTEIVTRKAIDEMILAGSKYGLPKNAIQTLTQDNPEINMLELSCKVMSKADMVIATGGTKLVQVAYGSGTPAYGVGAGNTPVIIHETADCADAAAKVVTGRSFDNGLICASEQHLIVASKRAEEFRRELEKNGTYFVESANDLKKLNEVILDENDHFESTIVGQSALKIASMAEIKVPQNTKVLVVKRKFEEIGSDPYSGEKIFPLLSWYSYDDFKQAVSWVTKLLDFQGKGHSAGLHIADSHFQSQNDLNYWSSSVSATHLIVNQATATSAGGSKFNYLTASTTLGCGSYGKTMPMESINLSVRQLLNYKALSMPLAKPRPDYGLL